jgi:hypothetical protein
MTKFQKINIAGNFLFLSLIKNLSVLMSKPQDKPSALKRESPALQKMKFMNFSDCESGSEYGSRDRTESESTTLFRARRYLEDERALLPGRDGHRGAQALEPLRQMLQHHNKACHADPNRVDRNIEISHRNKTYF